MGTALSGSPSDIARATPTFATSRDAVDTIDAAIATVSAARGQLGAVQNRFEHTIDQLGVHSENLTGSESRIRDAYVAQESMQFARNQILVQALHRDARAGERAPQALLALLN